MAVSSIGAIAITIAVYCVALFTIQFFMKHEASKAIIALSYISLLFMAFSTTNIAATYYQPYLWSDNTCYCRQLWATSLVSYIIAMYLLKAMYVVRTHFLTKDCVLGTPSTRRNVRIIAISLCISFLICVILIILMTTGECYPNPHIHGCAASFHVVDVYFAIVMIIIDCFLFGSFCYKWYGVLIVFKITDTNNEMSAKLIHSFIIQFILTVIAMLSCLFDGIVHLILREGENYNITMIVFLFDCTVVASCNFLMIKESQNLLRRLFCFCCGSSSSQSDKNDQFQRKTSFATRTLKSCRTVPVTSTMPNKMVNLNHKTSSNSNSESQSTTTNKNEHERSIPSAITPKNSNQGHDHCTIVYNDSNSNHDDDGLPSSIPRMEANVTDFDLTDIDLDADIDINDLNPPVICTKIPVATKSEIIDIRKEIGDCIDKVNEKANEIQIKRLSQ